MVQPTGKQNLEPRVQKSEVSSQESRARDQLTTPEADTIRILVATDNHVGYEERDPIRKDDSWKTFDEILNLGRKEDVRAIHP